MHREMPGITYATRSFRSGETAGAAPIRERTKKCTTPRVTRRTTLVHAVSTELLVVGQAR